jgi:hypothetical protein
VQPAGAAAWADRPRVAAHFWPTPSSENRSSADSGSPQTAGRARLWKVGERRQQRTSRVNPLTNWGLSSFKAKCYGLRPPSSHNLLPAEHNGNGFVRAVGVQAGLCP